MKNKYNTYSKNKKRHKKRIRIFKRKRYFLLLILVITSLALTYYLKEKVAFYYAHYFNRFEHKTLSNSLEETARIDRITGMYANKLFGFDISHYQNSEDILWDSLSIGNKTISLDFVILRATMGRNGKDKNFDIFWNLAKKHNKIRGAYHFYRPDEDPVLQANNFLESIQLEEGDLLPVLDIEKKPRKISKKQLKENLKIWLKIIEDKYGKKPILYTYYHYYKDNLRGEFDEFPLWLANYNDVDEPSTEDNWKLWQFTENGIAYGINTKVDLNIYNGNRWSFTKLTID